MHSNSPFIRRVAAVHDLSGFGRVSLTTVIPVLSTMGFEVCPLPTAILSNHTQYPSFSFLDLTEELPKIIAEWRRLAKAIPERLSFFIEKNMITPEEYLETKGKDYRNTPFLQVYGHEGEPCPVCGSRLEHTVIAGRGSTFCPICQH